MIMLERWPVLRRENCHVTEVARLRENGHCYKDG